MVQILRCGQRCLSPASEYRQGPQQPRVHCGPRVHDTEGGDRAWFKLSDEDKIGASPVLVEYDHRFRGIWAMAIDHKGATESSIAWMESKLNQAGCRGTKVVLKSDQEESIIALKKAVAIKRQAERVSIESPVRDSRANGAIGRTLRTWAAQVRALRHHLEYRLGKNMSNASALMSWMTVWAADVLTRY